MKLCVDIYDYKLNREVARVLAFQNGGRFVCGNFQNPLKFEEDCYERWKNELEIWQLVTDPEKKKQALAVTLSLTRKAREAALNIKAEDLNSDEEYLPLQVESKHLLLGVGLVSEDIF